MPQGNILRSVRYLNENTVWASVSGGGSLLKSIDGGNNWQTILLPERIYARDVFFINENIGWTSGQDWDGYPHYLLGTTNGGESWNIQISDTNFSITTIAFANERIGWASGNGSKVYYTTNGGTNWGVQAQFKGNINSLFLLDSLHIWAANTSAAGGAIFYSKDGGKNWLADSSINWANDIQFLDLLNGWVAGRGKISNTTDGGKNWHTQLDTLNINWNDLFVSGKNYGWAISGGETKIAITTNGGSNWIIHENLIKYSLHDIAFKDSLNGLAVGYGGAILKTSDSGKNWELVTERITSSLLTDIFFINDSIGWIAGWDGTILKTTNSGDNWLKLTNDNQKKLSSIYFIDQDNGYIVGEENIILKTTDGGLSWSLTNNYVGNWQDIDFSNYPVGWIIGGDNFTVSRLIKTTNGGETWNDVSSLPYTYSFPEIHFTSKEIGWIKIGDLSSTAVQQLYKTIDGGDTWDLIRWNYSDTAYYSWQFITDDIGWITTFPSPSILHTTDGGKSWEKYTTPESIKSISFLDSLNGWGSSPGEIYRTTDAGKTWTPQRAVAANLQKIKFVNNSLGFAIGFVGEILKTTTGGITSIEEKSENKNPTDFFLYQNYPNPFNSETIISFFLPEEESPVSIYIFDILGRVIKEIKTSTSKGKNSVKWDGKTDRGNTASGIYIYSVIYKGVNLQKKLIYLK